MFSLLFKDRIFKTLFKINVKMFDLFVFILQCNILLYLPDNVLLYLALIRPVFLYSSYCQAKLHQNNNQKNKKRGAAKMKIFS